MSPKELPRKISDWVFGPRIARSLNHRLHQYTESEYALPTEGDRETFIASYAYRARVIGKIVLLSGAACASAVALEQGVRFLLTR